LSTDQIEYPKHAKEACLRSIGVQIYVLVYAFLQANWTSSWTLVADTQIPGKNDIPFFGKVKSFSHIWVAKRRYGASTANRGQSAKYAFIDGRIPVQIEYIFRWSQVEEDELFDFKMAVVRRFRTNDTIANIDFPWALWYACIACSGMGTNQILVGQPTWVCNLGNRALSRTPRWSM